MASLELSDGRRIHYEVSGPVSDADTVLVFHHGQPGAALLWEPLVKSAARHGWPVVMLSRPGYATSDRQVGRTVASAADDVAAVLDHLGAGRFVTAGWSGGGPHALACGALLAPRCAAVATLAGVAPYFGVDDLDFTAGMGPENVEEFEAVIAGDPEAEGRIRVQVEELRNIQPDQLIAGFGGLLSEPDAAVLVGEVAEFMAAWMRLAASNGADGYWDDDLVFVGDWGFDLAAMKVPVTVWRAELDLMVPPAHGEWLASHVAGAEAVRVAGEGHISMVTRHLDEIVDKLAADAKSA